MLNWRVNVKELLNGHAYPSDFEILQITKINDQGRRGGGSNCSYFVFKNE